MTFYGSSSTGSPPSYGSNKTSGCSPSYPSYHYTSNTTDRSPLLPPPVDRQKSRNTLLNFGWNSGWIASTVAVFVVTLYFRGFLETRQPIAPPYWTNITTSPICSSIGTREYTAVLSYMPEGYHPYTTCSSIPITIHGREMNPLSCWSELFEHEEQVVDERGSRSTHKITKTITKARWLVNFDEPDCVPSWDATAPGQSNPFPVQHCHDHGTRIYTAFMTVSRVPPGLDAMLACKQTPAIIHGVQHYPNDCLEGTSSGGEPVVRAQFFVDESMSGCAAVRAMDRPDDACYCSPSWDEAPPGQPNPFPDQSCHDYGTRIYSAFMAISRIPAGLDALAVCRNTLAVINNNQVYPNQCLKDVNDRGEPVIHAQFFVNESGCTADQCYCVPSWDEAPPGQLNPFPDQSCHDYGTRIYSAFMAISHIPAGLNALAVCRGTPAIIHGNQVYPNQCLKDVNDRGEPVIRAQFFVNESGCTAVRSGFEVDNQCYCVPSWDVTAPGQPNPTPDQYCHEHGTRIYSAFMTVSRVPPGLDSLMACRSTPAVIHGTHHYPDQCLEENGDNGEPIIRAQFFIKEPSCTAVWSNVKPDYQCTRYGVKRHTGLLEAPIELDGLETCRRVPYTFFGRRKNTDLCEKVVLPDGSERTMGSWMIDFNVPECHPVLKDLKDMGCIESATRRVEGEVVDIGKDEDWYRMCTTTPLNWYGTRYLPVQCESRTIWFFNYKIALFDVLDASCV